MIVDRAAEARRRLAFAALLLGLLAYVPALTAAPGRMPSDSKLYLYLGPGRFLADAAGSFDPRQFAGWVPHQHVSYLWPAGPWFWTFETIGAPDWIAHRLWIGTVMLAAGLGARWCARLLGLSAPAALVAGVVYQVSPYVLPYVSRTSVMLLPWAGLGWIVALTIRASRRHTWGDPAAIGLVLVTVGAVNATALAMIAPAPVLWLIHVAWQRAATWRQVSMVAVKIGVFGLGTSLWWMTMLVLQGRHGTDVLPYSESLGDVSLTATAPEVWRGLGYWLFYVRDPFTAATGESLRYLTSTPAIALSFVVPIVCVAALVAVRWAHRRFALLLIAVGVVLAVGVHPIDDRSPLMWLLTGNGDGGLALALRSSTRALPLLWLGFALAAGALVGAAEGWSTRESRRGAGLITSAGVVVVVVVNIPALWTGGWVDPGLERDQDPPSAWIEAGRALDRADGDGRVLQLPGAEFGSYRWGHTVDQPLPSLTERPIVTRDLLPLGSPAAMDLLYALDDRIQTGTLEPASVAPIARLLGVDTVWLTNDQAFDRYRTARPEIVRDVVAGAPGIGSLASYGEPTVNQPSIPVDDERSIGDPRVGEPLAPVELAPVETPGSIVRAKAREIIVAGDGDGLVDAAATGLLDGTLAVRYSATLGEIERVPALDEAVGLIVTDTNRAEARHWRSSRDTRGYTESNDPDVALLRDVASDQRLPVFEESDPTVRTYADQRGPVQATATSYGEPFAYLPEHRPYMAIDGDPATAWLVGEHGDPIGERLRLTFTEEVEEISVRQPSDPTRRSITSITVSGRDGSDPRTVALDDRSRREGGQPVAVAGDAVEITIDTVAGGVEGTAGAAAGVGFVEIGHGLGPTLEVVRPPNDALSVVPEGAPLAMVLTRLRVDPMDRWRSDPEPRLIREFDLATARGFDVSVTARVDAGVPDDVLAPVVGWPAAASSRLAGSLRHAGVAAIDGRSDTSWITAFGEALGATLTIDAVSRPIADVRVEQPVDGFSRITAITLRSSGEERTIDLTSDGEGLATGVVEPPLPAGVLEVTIDAIEAATTVDRRHGDVVQLPAAITELEIPGAPTAALEPPTAPTTGCLDAIEIDGNPVDVAFTLSDGWLDGEPVDAVPCTPRIELGAGRHLLLTESLDVPVTIDRIVLDDGAIDAVQRARTPDQLLSLVTDESRFARTVVVRNCDDGCWLVLGEGYNPAWSATVDGVDLGEPVLLDGGFNGWRIRGESVVVELRWTAQLPLTIALVASAAIAGFAFLIAMSDRYRNLRAVADSSPPPRWTIDAGRIDRRSAVIAGGVWIVAAGLLIGPWWTLFGLAGATVLVATRRRRLAELVALSSLIAVAGGTIYLERRDAPFPGGGWPATFETLHGFGMFAVAALVAGIAITDDESELGDDDCDDDRDDDHDDDDDRDDEQVDVVSQSSG